MRSRFRIPLFFLPIAIVGVALWLFAPSPEPVCQGKPLGYWLAFYESGGPLQADAAVRQMGSNTTPVLIRLLQEPNPDLRDRVWAILQKCHLTKAQFAPDHLHNMDAYYAFLALGPLASNAVPRLISMLERDSSLFSQQAIPRILGKIGPSSEAAIPLLVQRTTNANAYVRVNSITALGQIHGRPQSVVPALINSLNDPFVSARIEAARSLGAFGKDAQSAVPSLLQLRHREILNAASEPAFVPLPGGGYDPRVGPNGIAPSVARKNLGWHVFPEDAVAAATNALKQIDPLAAVDPDVKN